MIETELTELLQLIVALGGLGAIIKIAINLGRMNTNMERMLGDIKDHEVRIRDLEHDV